MTAKQTDALNEEIESDLIGLEPSHLAALHASPTLMRLPIQRRPNPSTVCERCKGAIWFVTADSVKAYCRVMRLVSWSTEEPNALQACDGEELAAAELS